MNPPCRSTGEADRVLEVMADTKLRVLRLANFFARGRRSRTPYLTAPAKEVNTSVLAARAREGAGCGRQRRRGAS